MKSLNKFFVPRREPMAKRPEALSAYFEAIEPELMILLDGFQQRDKTGWPRLALTRLLKLSRHTSWTPDETREYKLLHAWAVETLRAGIQFKDMLLTVPS